MFIGTWIINFVISIIAFLLVFVGSLSSNTANTSLFRAGIAFLFFYMVTYVIRWLLMLASKGSEEKSNEPVEISQIEESIQGKASVKEEYSDEDIKKASQYVKDLIND